MKLKKTFIFFSSVSLQIRNMTYKDANNTIKHVLHTDVAFPDLEPQVQGGKDQWADIKPATDITNLKMSALAYRTRQVVKDTRGNNSHTWW